MNLKNQTVFSDLTPELVLQSFTNAGFSPSGKLQALNSYENRVYDVEATDGTSSILKFYRPGRWRDAAIFEEHAILQLLKNHHLPVAAPLAIKTQNGTTTLASIDNYRFSVFPKIHGRIVMELNRDQRKILGGLIGKMHCILSQKPLRQRPELNPETYGWASFDILKNSEYVPLDLRHNLLETLENVLWHVENFFVPGIKLIPTHGDIHLGNVIWQDKEPVLTDFDDMVYAPAVQDLWMLTSGTEEEKQSHLEDVLAGYCSERNFNAHEFKLIEPLRTLRMLNFPAWIATRFNEEAFRRTFSYFSERSYWEKLILDFQEQLYKMQKNNPT